MRAPTPDSFAYSTRRAGLTAPAFPGAPGDTVERTRLANGLTVLARRDASAPVVAIVTHVKAGYFDEPDGAVGVSHVLEHMYFKGTPTRGPGAIARETKRAGGYLNAGTIYDRTTYYAVLPSANVSTGLAVQADAYANSLIDAAELGRELEVIIEEERRKRDTASAVATEECYALLHDVHRIRRWRIGSAEGLRQLTREDVAGFYRAHYTPANTIVSIVGAIDPQAVLRDVERHYGALPAGSVARDRGDAEPDRTGFRWREFVRDVEHAQVVLGWRTVAPLHEDSAPLSVAAAILGAGRASRLYREVRERSLASAITAYQYAPTDVGVFVVAAEAPAERYGAAARAAWAQVRSLAVRGTGVNELTRVRRGIESRWRRMLESMEGQATYLAAWEALGGWTLGAEHFDALLGASPEQVTSAVGRHLRLDRAALVTLRPEAAPSFAADLPGARTMLADEPVIPGNRREAAAIDAPALVGLGTRAERVVGDISVFRTDGGVPVIVKQKPGAPIAHAQALFLGGVSDESAARAGRTTLLARTALQGTAHRDGPQLSEDLESLGGSVGAVVGTEAFGWAISVPTAQLGEALVLLAEVAEEPALPAAALDTERSIALSGLAQLRDDMSRQPTRLALAATFGDHAYGRPILGSEQGVAAATVSRLRAWHERRVRTGHGAVFVVGDAPPDEIAAAVRGAFRGLAMGSAPRTAAAPWPAESRESSETRDKAQTAIAMLFPAPLRADRRRYAAALVATVASGLGGRMFEALRDRESLAYSVHVGSRALRRAGWMSAYVACAPAKEEAARAGLLREFAKFADEPVTSEELERAKAYTLGSLAIRQQSTASVLSDIADAWMFGTLEEIDAEPREVAALTAADLQSVMKTGFDPARVVWGVVRGNG